ncbi:MAG: HAMP domain-containing protein [Chloroflexota bacterium]|nr:MAG: HAMP domain-containing protein [Chloroflexota bacterium]
MFSPRSWPLVAQTLVGPVLLLATMLIAIVLADRLTRRDDAIEDQIASRAAVASQAAEVLKHVLDLETGVRGYALARDAVFLKPYDDSREEIDPHIVALRQMVADRPAHLSRVDRIAELIGEWRVVMADELIRRVQANQDTGDLIRRGEGRNRIDAIRALVDDMVSEEAVALADLRRDHAALRSSRDALFAAIVGVALISFAIALLTARTVISSTRALSAMALRIGAGELDARVPVGGPREIAATTRAFNAMAKRMAEESRRRIEATAAAEAERATLHAVTDNMTDGLVVRDSRGLTRFCNARARELLGIPPEADVIGVPSARVLDLAAENVVDSEDWRARALDSIARVEERPSYEITIVRPVRREIEFQLFPFRRDGELDDSNRGIGVLIRDVSEHHSLVRQLRGSIAELDAFSYSVSHDLRAPLRAIDGFSRILLEDHGPSLDPDAVRDIEIVRANVQRMGQLIDDLLALARFGRQPLSRREADTEALVRSVVDELAPERDGRDVEFIFADLPPCHADPGLLRQVYANLLSNAIKYTNGRAQRRIEIGSLLLNGERVYYVRDNGVGFDLRYASKLFGVFQRVHAADEYEGTGVGLAIVKRIIQRHGGRVWADAAPDLGATFFFTLDGGGPNE